MSVHPNHLKLLLKSKFHLSRIPSFNVISVSNHKYDAVLFIYGLQLTSSVLIASKKKNFKQQQLKYLTKLMQS